jgi:hypothetical protein
MKDQLPYDLDQASGTITYWIDRDTGQKETASFAEIVDLLFYLKRRESDIRQMVYNYLPITIARPLMLVNGFYIGVTKDRQAVKVKASRYQEVMTIIEDNTRRQWLETQTERLEKASYGAGVHVVQFKPFDNTGATIEHNPNREVYTLADCPDYLIQQEQEKLRSPEHWAIFRAIDNLDSGKWVKLP